MDEKKIRLMVSEILQEMVENENLAEDTLVNDQGPDESMEETIDEAETEEKDFSKKAKEGPNKLIPSDDRIQKLEEFIATMFPQKFTNFSRTPSKESENKKGS